MKTAFKIGDKVRVSPENDNDNYDSFRDKVLIINHVATSIHGHRGYDETMEGMALYSFKRIGCSLYEYEIISA